ncbi:hypothetical protein BDR22DRAFT_888486 [Usnea florida]
MLPSSPRRFGPYIWMSLILVLLFLSHSTHCIPPFQRRLGIFADDFSFPFNMRLQSVQKSTPSNNRDDDERNPSTSPNMFADIIPTAQDPQSYNQNQTTDFGVDNLYEYALKSTSFRKGKDVRTLRKLLQQSNAQ